MGIEKYLGMKEMAPWLRAFAVSLKNPYSIPIPVFDDSHLLISVTPDPKYQVPLAYAGTCTLLTYTYNHTYTQKNKIIQK